MLGNKLDWTQKLGDAYLAQPKDLMQAVQALRLKAKQASSLNSQARSDASQDRANSNASREASQERQLGSQSRSDVSQDRSSGGGRSFGGAVSKPHRP